jgi:hypothetical protein
VDTNGNKIKTNYKSIIETINCYKIKKRIQNQLHIKILTFLQPHKQSYNIEMKRTHQASIYPLALARM